MQRPHLGTAGHDHEGGGLENPKDRLGQEKIEFNLHLDQRLLLLGLLAFFDKFAKAARVAAIERLFNGVRKG